MRIGDQFRWITFAVQSVDQKHFPSMTLSIAVSCRGFTGQIDEVCFDKESLECFLADLRQFERFRQGSVTLESLGKQTEHCKFRFKLFSTNRLGGMAVRAELFKINYLAEGHYIPLKTTVAFDIDPGFFNNILADFEQLLSWLIDEKTV